jgi:WD40 repeat protein
MDTVGEIASVRVNELILIKHDNSQFTYPLDFHASCLDLSNNCILAGGERFIAIGKYDSLSLEKETTTHEAIRFVKWIDSSKKMYLLITNTGSWSIKTFGRESGHFEKQLDRSLSLKSAHLSLRYRDRDGDCSVWRIFAGFADGNIRSWELSIDLKKNSFQCRNLNTLCSLGDQITCLQNYENLLIAGSWDGRLRIFDTNSESVCLRRTLSADGKSPIMSVAYHDNSITTGHYDGSITMWDFNNLEFSNKK